MEPMKGRPPDSIELAAAEEQLVGGLEDMGIDWAATALIELCF